MSQPGVATDHLSQHERHAIAVLDTRRMDHGMGKIAIGDSHHMRLAAPGRREMLRTATFIGRSAARGK